jgi:hypothetical protein
MPTKRRRIAHSPIQQISPAILSHLSEGLYLMPAGEDAEREVFTWKYFTRAEEKVRIFSLVREPILREWIRQRPGTRPQFWWLHDAPEKYRRRLGGVGDPAHEHLAYAESYDKGIPSIFVDEWSADYYNGRAHDIHGNQIRTDYREGDFRGKAIDPTNPPTFESEAAYLQRHGLLAPDEKRRLKPRDFKPIAIEAHSK